MFCCFDWSIYILFEVFGVYGKWVQYCPPQRGHQTPRYQRSFPQLVQLTALLNPESGFNALLYFVALRHAQGWRFSSKISTGGHNFFGGQALFASLQCQYILCASSSAQIPSPSFNNIVLKSVEVKSQLAEVCLRCSKVSEGHVTVCCMDRGMTLY